MPFRGGRKCTGIIVLGTIEGSMVAAAGIDGYHQGLEDIACMRLILANPRGFCAGVYMAIDVVDQLLDILDGEPIYVYHEIVHNLHVVNRFKNLGVTFVEDIADVPENSIIVFSAHGVSPAVRGGGSKPEPHRSMRPAHW